MAKPIHIETVNPRVYIINEVTIDMDALTWEEGPNNAHAILDQVVDFQEAQEEKVKHAEQLLLNTQNKAKTLKIIASMVTEQLEKLEPKITVYHVSVPGVYMYVTKDTAQALVESGTFQFEVPVFDSVTVA